MVTLCKRNRYMCQLSSCYLDECHFPPFFAAIVLSNLETSLLEWEFQEPETKPKNMVTTPKMESPLAIPFIPLHDFMSTYSGIRAACSSRTKANDLLH